MNICPIQAGGASENVKLHCFTDHNGRRGLIVYIYILEGGLQIPRRALFRVEFNTNIRIGVGMESSEAGVARNTSPSSLLVFSLITSYELAHFNRVESNS
jgi:hypothetical protein